MRVYVTVAPGVPVMVKLDEPLAQTFEPAVTVAVGRDLILNETLELTAEHCTEGLSVDAEMTTVFPPSFGPGV